MGRSQTLRKAGDTVRTVKLLTHVTCFTASGDPIGCAYGKLIENR